MIINEEIKTTLGGLNMDRISSPSGEVLWMAPKVIFLEYILSTGTLYINTGLISNIDLQFECKFTPINTGIDSTVFGCFRLMDGLTASQLKRFAFGLKAPAVGSKNHTEADKFSSFEDSVPYILEYKNRIFTATSENSTQSFDFSSRTIDFQVECYLFARHDVNLATNTSLVRCPALGKLYYHIAYNAQGEIIKEFRPCSYNGKIGLWELIENKFYPNIGEGEFLKGPELHQVRFVDYIESTGTQYIDTGFKVNSKTVVETSFNYTYSSGETGYRGVFGCGNNYNTTDNFMASVHLGNNNSIIGYAGGANNLNIRLSDESLVLNKDITFKEKISGMSIKDSSQEYNIVNTGKTTIVNPTRSMYIFSTNTANGDLNGKHIKMKLYDFKIWDGLVLVRDFRPCIYTEDPWKTNALLKVGLWDLVSHKFYGNDGTGEFIAGEKILEFTDFLESDGNQYIKTGLIANDNLEFKTKVKPVGTNAADVTVFGWIHGASKRYHFGLTTSGVGTLALAGMGLFIDNTIYNFEYSGHILKVNDFTKDFSDKTVIDGLECYLFTRNDTTDNIPETPLKGLIYTFKSYRGNWLVRDLRPCVYKGESGMWDMVYDKFYGNSGTGEFLTNLDYIPKFIPWIKSSGTLYIDTGIIPTLDYTVECKAAKDVERSIFGSGLYDYVFTGAEGKNYIYLGGTSRNSRANVNVDDSAVHTWGIKDRKGYVDGIAKTATVIPASTTAPSNNLYLFCRNNGGNLSDAGSHKMYYCKIWDASGNLIRNLRPCIYKKKYGMWDLVESKFYENKGTGNFIYEGTEWSYDISTIDNNYFNTIFITSNTIEDIIENNNLTITGDIQDTYSDNNLNITL